MKNNSSHPLNQSGLGLVRKNTMFMILASKIAIKSTIYRYLELWLLKDMKEQKSKTMGLALMKKRK